MPKCAACGTETPDSELNYGDNGKICDACQLDQDLASTRPGLGSAWLQLSGAWFLMFMSFCISSRTTSRYSFTAGAEVTETVKYGVDLPGLVLAGLTVVVMFSTFIALVRAYPHGSKAVYWMGRIAGLGSLFLLTPLTAYSLYDASPRTTKNTSGPGAECDAGSASACNDIGVQHDRRGQQQQALEYFNRACDLKHGMACRNVALVNMQLEEPNRSAAMEGFQRGCRLGYQNTCVEAVRVSHLFMDGEGLTELRAELEPLCANQVGRSCTALGTLLAMGAGGEQELERGLALLGPECDKDSGLACMNLAVSHRNGTGVEKDIAKANALDTKACKLGIDESCERMKAIAP